MREEQNSNKQKKRTYTKEDKNKDIAGAVIVIIALLALVPTLSQGKHTDETSNTILQAHVLN